MTLPENQSSTWRRSAIFFVFGLLLLAVTHFLDKWAYTHLANAGVNNKDWGRMFRSVGYLPTWLLVAAALALIAAAKCKLQKGLAFRHVFHPAYLLVGAAALSGGVAELLKIIVRRYRPNEPNVLFAGEYLFRDWNWSASKLGMPSSHAAVAFGAAFILMRLYPAAWPVFLIMAIGCGLTRVMEQAHFLSDTVGGAVVAYAVVWALWSLHIHLMKKLDA